MDHVGNMEPLEQPESASAGGRGGGGGGGGADRGALEAAAAAAAAGPDTAGAAAACAAPQDVSACPPASEHGAAGTGSPPPSRDQELAAARDQVLRAKAELDNVQKRMRREMDEQRAYWAAEALRDFLPVLDNLDMTVMAARQAGGNLDALVVGVDRIRQQVEDLLVHRGAERIQTAAAVFDPAVHEALSVVPVAGDGKPNTVVHEVRRGYRVKDRVLRPAQVIVQK